MTVVEFPRQAEQKPLPEIKSCPFCGETDADLAPIGDDESSYDCAVICEACFATGPIATIGCRDSDEEDIDLETEAIELWNRRKS